MSQLIPVGQEWNDLKNLASALVSSGMLPQAIKTPQAAVAIILMARELGIGPMEGFAKISVIQGKPTVGPELMKGMVHRKLPKAKFMITKTTDKECIIAAARPGDKLEEFSFTWADAEKMGLTSKSNWVKMPKTMLKWRCIGDVCRTVFPDCLSGISYTPEELGAEINEEGEVITLKPEEPELVLTQEPSDEVIHDHDEGIPDPPSTSSAVRGISQDQRKRLYAMMGTHGWDIKQVKDIMQKAFGYNTTTQFTQEDYQTLCHTIETQTYEKAKKEIL